MDLYVFMNADIDMDSNRTAARVLALYRFHSTLMKMYGICPEPSRTRLLGPEYFFNVVRYWETAKR